MGATKRHIHSDADLLIADLFKALGHPVRVRIITELLENDNLNCTELGKKIPLAQSTISQHIKELYSQRILGYTVIGSSAFYYVNVDAVQKGINFLIKSRRFLSKSERDIVNLYILPMFKNRERKTVRN